MNQRGELCKNGHRRDYFHRRGNGGSWECRECAKIRQRRYRKHDGPRVPRRGSDNNNCKVSYMQIQRMRSARNHGTTCRELARIYDLHEDTVSRLTRGVGRIDDIENNVDRQWQKPKRRRG